MAAKPKKMITLRYTLGLQESKENKIKKACDALVQPKDAQIDLEKKHASLKKKFSNQKNKVTRLNTSLKSEKQKIVELKQEMEQIKLQLVTTIKEKAKLVASLEAANKRSEVFNEECIRLQEINNLLEKENQELRGRAKENDGKLENARKACKRLFNSTIDQNFVQANRHLINEAQKLYKSNSHSDKIEHCPAIVYMNSVQAPGTFQSFINNSVPNDGPPTKKRKPNTDTGNECYSKSSLEALVMRLEKRHSDEYDLWRNVLWALNKYGLESGYDTLQIADRFSKQSSKYKNLEDVKETFESSDGTISLQYLIDKSKIWVQGLDRMTKYLSSLMPKKCLPLKVTQVDISDHDKFRLSVQFNDEIHTLFIILNLCVLTTKNGKPLNFLKPKIHSNNSKLAPLCADMKDGFTATLKKNEYVFEAKNNSATLVLNQPLDAENSFITYPDRRRKSKPPDVQRILMVLRAEALKFLSLKSGIKFCDDDDDDFDDDDYDYDGNYIVHMSGRDPHTTRSDNELMQALFDADPDTMSRYCHTKKAIYHCNPETNVWCKLSEKAFDFHLTRYLNDPQKLKPTAAEVKHIRMKTTITNIRNLILGQCENLNFADLLNSKLHLFVTYNKTVNTLITPPVLRCIQKEDLAEKTSGWSYDDELAAKYKESVRSYFNKLLPEQCEREWFLSFVARLLNGHRTDEFFVILTDERKGKTGKTTLISLLRAVFGNFYLANSKFVVDGGNRHNEEYDGGIYTLKDIRLLVADGLQKNDTLNCNFIKAITGESNYHIKGAKTPSNTKVEFFVQAGLIMLSTNNNMPKFNKTDDDFLRRIVVCPMRSRFVSAEEIAEMKNNKENMKNTYIADDSLRRLFPEWRSATLDLLMEHYNQSLPTIPDSMTDRRKFQCDMPHDDTLWLNKYICRSKNENEYVSAYQIMGRIKKQPGPYDPYETKVLKSAMEQWATENGYKYKKRHVYMAGKGKRIEAKSAIMNAAFNNLDRE